MKSNNHKLWMVQFMVITFIQHPPCSRPLLQLSGWGKRKRTWNAHKWGDFMSPRLFNRCKFRSIQQSASPSSDRFGLFTKRHKQVFLLYFFISLKKKNPLPLLSSLPSKLVLTLLWKALPNFSYSNVYPTPTLPKTKQKQNKKTSCVFNGSNQHHKIAAWESRGWSHWTRCAVCVVSPQRRAAQSASH